MIRSFLNAFLPEDEYKRMRILYFMAEATFILSTLLFLYLISESFIVKLNVPGDMLALFAFGFLIIYITLRYMLTGIEHPEFATEKKYKQEKRIKIYTSVKFWIIFIVIFILFKGIPSNIKETFNIVGPATLAAIFLFILNYFSLKKSYKKNKDLFDD